jgi:hypothetical protein
LALAGHPDFFYLSEKSEGQFISQVKMQRELTENELLDFKHQKYALTLVGDLEIENDIILLKVSYMEKIPLEGIIEVVVEKD